MQAGSYEILATFNFLRKLNIPKGSETFDNRNSDNILTNKIRFQADWGFPLIWLIQAYPDISVFNQRTE